jgi:glycosyltransferase involved in cell wall biosynthesis
VSTSVSVIIPTYNRREYVQEAINSVLSQTYTNYEIIVVDDGSTDGTAAALARYGNRIRFLAQPNSGVAAARNSGIQASKGTLIAFLDADDLFTSIHLATLTAILDRSGAEAPDWVGGTWRYIDAAGTPLTSVAGQSEHPDLTTRGLLFSWPVQPSGVLVRRQWLEKVGGFDQTLSRAEECDLWLRLAHAGCKMQWTTEVVCAVRLHAGQKSRHVLMHRASVLAFLESFFSRPDVGREIRSIRSEVMAYHLFNYACREYFSGLIAEAREDLLAAGRLDPRWFDARSGRVLGTVVGHALSYRSDMEPVSAVHIFFQNLPSEASALKGLESSAVARATAAEYFRAHHRGDKRSVRRIFPRLVLRDPSWLLNVGVISIAARSWIGRSR